MLFLVLPRQEVRCDYENADERRKKEKTTKKQKQKQNKKKKKEKKEKREKAYSRLLERLQTELGVPSYLGDGPA